MVHHDRGHLAEIWWGRDLFVLQSCKNFSEKPGTTEAAPSDGDAITVAGLHHFQRVLGRPDVAVSDDWDLEARFQLSDPIPICMAVIELGCGSGVERDSRTALLFSDPTGFEEIKVLVVDPETEFDGQRNVSSVPHRFPDDFPEQIRSRRKSGASSLPSDLSNGTAEVEVEMINGCFSEENPDGLRNILCPGSVQLQTSGGLIRGESGEFEGFFAPFDECSRCNHFRNAETGAEGGTDSPERGVRHTGHWGQDDGWGDHEVAELQWSTGLIRVQLEVLQDFLDITGDQDHTEAGSTLRQSVVLFLHVADAGDIEMHPGDFLGNKLLQEGACRQGAAPA